MEDLTDLQISLSIKQNSTIGLTFVPYIIKKKDGKEYFQGVKKITLDDIQDFDILKPNWVKELITHTTELNEEHLNKKINPKHSKISLTNFLKDVEKVTLTYFNSLKETYTHKILKLVIGNNISLFTKDLRKDNLYESDFIFFSEKPANVKFYFEKKEDTLHYNLKLNHNDKNIPLLDNNVFILTNDNPYIIANNKLIGFGNKTTFNGNKLKPFLSKEEIVINEKLQNVFFEKFVKEAVKNFDYDIKGFDIVKKK